MACPPSAPCRGRVPKIRILPEGVSNKIAAGEVVERPASVVKELVENALDAASSRIHVEVEKGGRTRIRVSDNGVGMERDDALLALERYATSKIQTDKDLFNIKTLGFRGEALPSIASVSRFTLVTNADPEGPGTEIRVEGGKILRVAQTGAPRGTLVSVEHLFFNTPARRKFLKTVPTEMGHIVDAVDRIALGWPGVAFELISNGKTIRRFSPESGALKRVVAVLGADLSGKLHEVRHAADGLTLRGWIASPEETRSTGRAIYIYVNGRFVRDRVLRHALMEGFRGRLVKGAFPLAVLMVGLPEDQVDVNVHPTKSEVRFPRPRWVHDQVAAAVARTLGARTFSWRPGSNPGGPGVEVRKQGVPFESRPLPASPKVPELKEPQAPLWKAPETDFPRVIGQFRQTYIVCESREGLLLIDQHAADERILYEQIRNAHRPSGQRLLVPEVLELPFRESALLTKLLPALNALAMEVESFGENTFVIKSTPAVLKGRPLMPMIRELVEKAAETGVAGSLEKALDACLAVVACHGAVRAGQTLSKEAMEAIVAGLHACRNPAHCPHGRPAFIQWSDAFLEKAFFRSL